MTAGSFLFPRSADEAVGLLAEAGDDLVVLGGGTIVMGLIHDGAIAPRRALSLARAGLNRIDAVDDHVTIGAAVTLAQLATLDALPIVAAAAQQIGGPAVRTTATVGGNLFAAPPHGDLAVPLLALDAQVTLAGHAGTRTIPLDAFLARRAPPDAGRIGAAPDELVTAIQVPRPVGNAAYLKLARRQANAAAVVAIAARVLLDDAGACADARIALGAAGPHAFRAATAEAALRGQPFDADHIAAAAEAAMSECDPPTDALASAWYRRRMVGVYVRRALESLRTAD